MLAEPAASIHEFASSPIHHFSRGRQADVLDFIFIALSILFFAVNIGYVVACDRLMK
jgi:hypothetical protein